MTDFMQTPAWIFARLIRTGWAVRSPVITEMLVLSEERITPRSVAPSGSISYGKYKNIVKSKGGYKCCTCISQAEFPVIHSVYMQIVCSRLQ